MTTPEHHVDFERLMKLRLAVARHGEMDGAAWWNTQGLLGRRGGVVLKRGFPITHRFVQARVVFSVASSRCKEVFAPPGCVTLWHLPADLEAQFQERWQEWLDATDQWSSTFDSIEQHEGEDLIGLLRALDLLTDEQMEVVSNLRRSAESRAVALPSAETVDDELLTLLAAAFDRGEPNKVAIPYAKIGN